MQLRKYAQKICWQLLLLLAMAAANTVVAQSYLPVVEYQQRLTGSGLVVNATSTVQNNLFFNSAYSVNIDAPYPVKNIVTFGINEDYIGFQKKPFTATLRVNISHTNAALAVDTFTQDFVIKYDTTSSFQSQNTFTFNNAHKVVLKVIAMQVIAASGQDITSDSKPYLMLENKMQVQPRYKFSCTTAVGSLSASDSAKEKPDELNVSWGAVSGAHEYDLEWAYIDSNAYTAVYHNTVSAASFDNNASRVSIKGTRYAIPLMYNDAGYLCFRVRPVQYKDEQRLEGAWSTVTSQNGIYAFRGHERSLNWQSTVSYAEDGKRKVVVQYYDGSLRSRQTVTKDNTSNKTVVAESLYDYQGRPVIQILPVPTLNSIIGYTKKFNTGLNGSEYEKGKYDTLPNPGAYCSIAAEAMDTSSGASKYYSRANPDKSGLNSYIPDAEGYPFTETQYEQDGTDRISKQSGVGGGYKLGSGHEIQYYYSTPSQDELDALFGTEVGDRSHYFKNAVRDANGQFSVSYVDMSGHTIATALAGPSTPGMDALLSNTSAMTTEVLADSNNAIIHDRIIEHTKSLFVSDVDDYTFKYNLNPQTLSKEACEQGKSICYSCLYDLKITITDNCNNQTLPDHKAYEQVYRNFSIDKMDSASSAPGFNASFTLRLLPGNYTISKQLSISKYGTDYYRDSVFLPNNTCTTFEDFIQEQRNIVANNHPDCVPSCTACLANLGTWPEFKNKFLQQTGISDSAQAQIAYRKAADACASLCDTHNEIDGIREAMLLDVTPPSGQYANLADVSSPYSVFYLPGNNLPVRNQDDNIIYLDAAGKPDYVVDDRSGNLVKPNKLDSLQFSNKFKTSWAEALLPLHPEYPKLLVLQSYTDSYNWDKKVEKVETYQEAFDSGYLNPLALTSTDPSSPYYRFPAVAAHKDPLAATMNAELKLRLDSYVHTSVSGVSGSAALSLWSVAMVTTRLGKDTAGLYECYSHPFNVANGCTADLDIAWQGFRTLYLQIKKDLIDNQINAGASESPTAKALMNLGFSPNFTDAVTALSESGLGYALDGNNVNVVKDSAEAAMQVQYDANCKAYAQLWMEQLAPCTEKNIYNADSVALVIIPKLIMVCKEGSDATHPKGSSSVRPASTYAYRSFEEVLNEYNQQHGIKADSICNPELITALKPYDRPVVLSNVPIYSTPDDCQCNTIKSLYSNYQQNSQGNGTFSGYLKAVLKTDISEADINTLLHLCDKDTSSCRFLSQPILLPPALQCGMLHLCATCTEVDTFYNRFGRTYPGMKPASVEADTTEAQHLQNQLFASYMNNRLGFTKQAWEYLEFRDSCLHFGNLYDANTACSGVAKEYNVNEAENSLVAIQATPDGGYIMAGRIHPLGEVYSAAYIVKADSTGNIQWAKSYKGVKNSLFSKIKPAGEGGYIVAGTTAADNDAASVNGKGKILVARISEQGNVSWSHTMGFNTTGGEVGRDIISLSTGGYAVCGVYNYEPNNPDWVIFTLDATGHTNWIKLLGNASLQDDGGVLLEDHDTLVFAGSTFFRAGASSSNPYYDATLLKLNKSNGTVISQYGYKFNSANNFWEGIEKAGDDYQLICRSLNAWGAPGGNGVGNTVRIDRTGNVVNTKLIRAVVKNSTDDGIVGMPFAMNTDGSYMAVAIEGEVAPSENRNTYWSKFDASGNLVGTNRVKLPGDLAIFQVRTRGNGGYAGVGTLNRNAVFMLTNPLGQVGCYDNAVTVPVDIPSIIRMPTPSSSPFNSYRFRDDLVTTGWDTAVLTPAIETTSVTKYGCGSDPGTCAPIYIGPMLCGNTTAVFDPARITFDEINNCSDTSFFIQSKATELYRSYIDSIKGNFEDAYVKKCLEAYRYESFTVRHSTNEYHYTLYYYDLAGNLTKTVPPAGVHDIHDSIWLLQVKEKRALGQSLIPKHTLVTYYAYNTLNQVVAQKTPDAGISHFWYDRLGRLVLSQNANQIQHQQYSYTKYDVLGRITEVGQLTSSAAIVDNISRNDALLQNWYTDVANTREQITLTVYDLPYSFADRAIMQRNLRNRVSYAALYNNAAAMSGANNPFATGTFYSYDIHGNVDTLLQFYKEGAMGAIGGNQYKKMVYQYDLVSGKVNYVAYQPGHDHPDAFYHRYYYDAENRLTNVETSRDSVYWENEAWYNYYKHGPLAHVTLGKLQVQGLDYIYTLQGWMKAVNPTQYNTGGPTGNGGDCAANSAVNDLVVNFRIVNGPPLYSARTSITLEEGFDSNGEEVDTKIDSSLLVCALPLGSSAGMDGTSATSPAADAFKYVLHYNNGDYAAINAPSPDILVSPQLGSDYRPLYNGNISGMGVTIGKLNQPQWYNYKYDQLNRLVQMDAWKASTTSWSGLQNLGDYHEGIAYDANGNITSYQRNGTYPGKQDSLPMDILTYHYVHNKNQLAYVDDAVPASRYSTDIDAQDTGNYVYDSIGNMIRDVAGNIYSIEWTVYGKIKRITKYDSTHIDYTYDVAGNRISKAVNDTITWYVRDAQGNVMSVYEKGNPVVNNGNLSQTEIPLYGSSRLGILHTDLDVSKRGPDDIIMPGGEEGRNAIFIRGKKLFELTNHLGNVLATVSDRRMPFSSNGITVNYYNADVVSAQDYYPFGMLQPGRTFNAGGYRYGFNGKENDNEVKGEGNQQDYGMRIYDPRVGRFLSVDPITKKYPELTPYQFASNRPIDGIDQDGLEHSPVFPRFENSGNRTWQDYVGEFDNAVIDLVNLVPTTWNALVNVGQSLKAGTLATDAKNDFKRVGAGLAQVGKNLATKPITTLTSPEAVNFAASMYIGGKAFTVAGNAKSSLVSAFTKEASVAKSATAQAAANGGKVAYLETYQGMEFLNDNLRMVDQPLQPSVPRENLALGLRENLNEFSEAIGAKNYRQFTSGGFKPNEIMSAIENPNNNLHFNLQGFSLRNYRKYLNTVDASAPIQYNNATNGELFKIYNTPGALDRTTFYNFTNGEYAPKPKPL